MDLQGDTIKATIGVGLLLLHNGEGHDDIALFLLLAEGLQPQVAATAASMMQGLFAAAQLLGALLAKDEGHHALVVSALKGSERGELGVEGIYIGLDILMEIAIASHITIDDIGREQWQDATKAIASDEEFCGYNLISEFDGFAKQGAIVVDSHQTLIWGIARIEQAGIHLTVALVEVIAQNAVVEQQLHIVVLQLQAVGIVTQVFYLLVLARLLFYQQSHVGCHQVDTSLQSQFLANERGLEEIGTIGWRQQLDGLTDVFHLLGCHLLEPFPVEVVAGGKAVGLLAIGALERLLEGGFRMVDDIVEGRACEVSQ